MKAAAGSPCSGMSSHSCLSQLRHSSAVLQSAVGASHSGLGKVAGVGGSSGQGRAQAGPPTVSRTFAAALTVML